MVPKQALILEKDGAGKHFIRDRLRERGYHARYLNSVRDVAKDWQALRDVDLFVIADDIKGDGLKVLKQLRRDALNPNVPVLYILANKSEDRVLKVIAEKPDAVLVRPYTIASIESRLDAVLPVGHA